MKRPDLKRTFKLISHGEALCRLLNSLNIEPLCHEEITLIKAMGRVLAVDIESNVDIPKGGRAVFDGYIVRPVDIQKASLEAPVFLQVVGETFPGEKSYELSLGQAIFTACGGPVPEGEYALIKVENTRLVRDKIEIRFPASPGENIAAAGEDVKRGKRIFTAGHTLRPQDVGLLAGLGIRNVRVFKRPRVGIISVGDELVALGEEAPLKIANNYALIVSGLVEEFGGAPLLFGIVQDNLNMIKERLSEALEETDIVVTISGCSVGPKDLVPDAINELGDPGLTFHGINLSPGKVVGAGVIENKPIVMLPGHIVSAYAGFYLFVVPLLAKYAGLSTDSLLPVFQARLALDVKAKRLVNFLRVRLNLVDGGFVAVPLHGGSGLLSTLVGSNGFSIIPAGRELKKGDIIDVALYGKHELTHIVS